MFIFFFFLYLLPMACEMKNNEVQTFLPGPEVVVPRYRFGDKDPKNHGICVYIYIYIYICSDHVSILVNNLSIVLFLVLLSY